jgi:hypothetical protein
MQGTSSPFGIKMNGTDMQARMQGQHAGEILPVNLYSTVNLKFGENLIVKILEEYYRGNRHRPG